MNRRTGPDCDAFIAARQVQFRAESCNVGEEESINRIAASAEIVIGLIGLLCLGMVFYSALGHYFGWAA